MTLQGLILRELSDGTSVADLARAIGVAPETLHEILDGRVPEDPAVLKRFAGYFRMDMAFLQFGLPHATCGCQLLPRQPTQDVVTYRKVPLRSWSALAKDGHSHDPKEPLIETDVAGEGVFALSVQDDSMQPLFHPGEIIFVRPEAQWDEQQYVVAKCKHEGGWEVVLRQLQKAGRQHVLHALNRDYPDRPLKPTDVVLGRVTRLRLNL
jgi:transcriptional regulator with XRE-family HTH domain